MSERPTEIKRLDSVLGGARVAHEAIFEMRRELIANRQEGEEEDDLLGESAQIVTEELPDLTAAARELVGKWEQQSLLDPSAAETTLGEVASELDRIEPEVQAALARQREIASRVRGMLEP